MVAIVDEDNCTGCLVCVPFCPTDCIRPLPKEKYGDPIPPVQIIFDECVGCMACAHACDLLSWKAVRAYELSEFEEIFGVVVHDTPEDPRLIEIPR